MDPTPVPCSECTTIDMSSIVLSLDTINQTQIGTNEYLYNLLHTSMFLLTLQAAILTLLAGSLIIIMVSVWRRS